MSIEISKILNLGYNSLEEYIVDPMNDRSEKQGKEYILFVQAISELSECLTKLSFLFCKPTFILLLVIIQITFMLEKYSPGKEQSRESMYEEFRNEGYLKIPDILTSEEAEIIKEESWQEYLRRSNMPPVPDQQISYKLYQAAQNIESVALAARNERLLDKLEVLLGPNIVLALNRHNHVSSGRSATERDDWHRDYGEWSRGLLTAVVYCDDATPENGCTELIPQSHLWYSPGHDINGGYYFSESIFDEYQEKTANAKQISVSKGDVLLFDGLLFHRGGINQTEESRHSIVLGYHSVDQLEVRDFDPTRSVLVRGTNLYRGNDK